jgi:hypothetical protein
MNLPESDVKQFLRLYHSILFYTNKKYKILEGLGRPIDIYELSADDLLKLKDRLYSSSDLIDSFVRDNPDKLSSDELEIVSSWKNFVRGRFYIIRHLKNYSIFLDSGHSPRSYGVLGFLIPIEEMMGPSLPRLVETTLLPFRGKIIYDGNLLSFNVLFGASIRKSIIDSFNQAKTNFGVITSLPVPNKESKASGSDVLRGYLKTEYSRNAHHEEIQELIDKNPDLMIVYCEEMGRVHARTYRKNLKAVGIVEGWFALIDGMIVASGRTQEEVERISKSLLPPEKMKLVYIFHLKAK